MGAISSAQRDSKRDESAVSEPSAGQDEAQEDSAAEKLLQKNGQISGPNGNTESQPDEINVPLEDVGSGYVTLKEDNTETTEDLQEGDTSQTNTEELAKETLNADGVAVKEVEDIGTKQNDIEVGFKKMFRLVGFKFTLKKDKVAKTDEDEPTTDEQDKKVVIPSEDSRDATEDSPVSTNQQDADETKKDLIECDIQDGSKDEDVSAETDQEMAINQITQITEQNEETPPDKEHTEGVPQSPEPEETMSPIKKFFTQGIFASLRKKRKEEALKEKPEEEFVKTDKEESEKLSGTAKEDTSCICLNIPNITPEEGKDLQTGEGDEWKPAGEKEQTNPPEQDKVPASPIIRLFRKLSTRRQRDTKPDEASLIQPENLGENVESPAELVQVQKEEEEAKMEEPKPADADEITDLSPEESKKKSDSTVSWESLICLKRVRKTSDSEDAMQDKGEEPRKSTESPIGSSTEGDYDHLTSSNEQAGEESGSTWKSLKKLVTPKRKARMEESGSSEQIPSDTEIAKDESSCSIKKLIPGRKKRRSDVQQEQLSSEDTGKGTGADDEDDETPAVVPLSEFEIIEPESLKEIKDGTGLEKESQPLIEEDKPKVTKPSVIPSHDVRPSVLPMPSDYIEDLTEFISKHQQLSDIPEEGIIEESVATPESSAEWTTQDDTLAEDFVELTADAVTAPEPASEQGDETTEMVSAVSQLTESPKTSGNVTPVPPEYDVREVDVIIQEAVETSYMTPSILSITTKDTDTEALAVSVSPCILESTILVDTKVLVAHEKAEATTICIGLVSQEIGALEEVIPSPLVEGISEINEAVPTELVSEDITEGSELAGFATDDVYEVEVKDIKTEVHEALPADVSQTQSEVHLEVLEDEVKEYPKDVVNGHQESAPVQMAVISVVQGETLLQEIEGPLETALEAAHEKQALYTEITVEGEKEHKLPDIKLSATDIEHVAPAEVVEVVEQNIIVSLTDSTIDEASEITEDMVQVSLAEVVETATHNAVVSVPETAIDEATQITETKVGVLASAVECPETAEVICIVTPGSDSLKAEAVIELEEELQMENVASIRYGDGHEIQVEVKDVELGTAQVNIDSVIDAATAVDKAGIYEKVEESRDDGTAQQQVEPTPAEESSEHFAEETVPNIQMEIAAEPPCEENELNIAVKEVSPSAVTTDEPEQPQAALEITTTECVDKNITSVEDHKPTQSTGDEVSIVPLNEAKKTLEIAQVPVISSLTLHQQDSAVECQPLTFEKPEKNQPENQKIEFSVDAHETEAATESVKEESAKTDMETTCTEAEVLISCTLSKDGPEQETTKPEICSEIATEPEKNFEPVAVSVKTVPEVDQAQQPQADTLPSKPDENQGTEQNNLKLYEEDKQVAGDTVKVTEPISEVAPTYAEETKQSEEKSSTAKSEGGELKISSQAVISVQPSEETSSKDRVTVTAIEAINIEAPLVVNQEPEALATSAIHVNEKAKPQQEAAEVVSKLNAEISTGSGQHIDAAATEMDKGTLAEMELKAKTSLTISEPEKVELIEQVTDTLRVTESKSETLIVQQVEVQKQVLNEHTAAALEVTEPKVETHVVTEVKMETAAVSENEVEKPVVTSVVTELEVETPVLTSVLRDLKVDVPVVTSTVTGLKAETPVVTSAVTDLKAEMPVMTSLVTEPEAAKSEVTLAVTVPEVSKTVVTSAVTVPEAVVTLAVMVPEADKTLVTSAVTVPEAEKMVVTSVVTVPEAEKTVATSAATVPEAEKTVATSAVTVPEAEKTVATSAVTVPEAEKTVVTSAVTVPEAEKTVATSAVTVPEAEKTVVTSAVTVPEAEKTVATSAVTVPEAEKTVVTSAVTVPEAEKTVVTSAVTVPEAEKTVVTSAVTVPEAEKTVVTSAVTVPEAEKTVATSAVTVPEAEKTVATSAVTVPEAEKTVATSAVTVPEAEKTVVTSAVTVPEAEKTVVTSAVTVPEAEKTVVTSAVTVPEAEKTVVTSAVTVPEAETPVAVVDIGKTVLTSVVAVPEADNTVVTSALKEPEAEKTIVTSAVAEPEIDKTVVMSVVTVPEADKTVEKKAVTEPEADKTVEKEAVTEPEADKTVEKEAVTEPEADKTVEKEAVTEPEADKMVEKEAVTEPEADKTVEKEAVTEPEADKTVATVVVIMSEADKTVVTSVVTKPEADKTVVTSVVTKPEADTAVVTSVVTELQVQTPDVRTVPAVDQGITVEEVPKLGETPTVAPEMQTAVVPEVPEVTEIVAVIKENDAKVKTPVVVALPELIFEVPVAAEVVIQTAVSELEAELPDVASALITETVVQTYVEKKTEMQSTVVAFVKEDKVNEPPVITMAKTPEVHPVLQTCTVIPTIQTPATVKLEQKPEVPVVMPELSKTKPETSDAVGTNTAEIASHKVTVTEVEVKQSPVVSVTTELLETPVKKEEAPVITSVVKEPATIAPVIQTPTLVATPTIVPAVEKPTVVQIPTVDSGRQTFGVGVKEAEVPAIAPEVKDIHKEASCAVVVEVKPSQMEAVKATVTTEQVTQKEDTKSLQTVNRGPTEVPASIAKAAEPLPDVEDDVWEDAVDDMRDDEVTKAGAV